MFRLPEGWGAPEVFDDVVVAAGVRLRCTGVAAVAPSGEEVCGAAAAREEPTKPRAWFELAERVCIMGALAARGRALPTFDAEGNLLGTVARARAFPTSDDPTRWMPARSNGVALHRDWPTACARAYGELVERDRVLRAWLGEIVPAAAALTDRALLGSNRYEWCAFSLPTPEDGFGADRAVAVVAGFPRRATDPLALGFGARATALEATRAATNEALQQLAFLWGEPLARRTGPPSAATHLGTYQRPKNRPIVRRWLEVGHADYAVRRRAPKRPEPVRYLDLTAAWLDGRARVAKAISDAAVPFGFGALPGLAGLPRALRIHPIC